MSKGKILILGTLAAALAASAEAATDLWLHINVHEGDDSRVTVNLPLSIVEKAAPLIPVEARSSGRVRLNDREVTAGELRDLWSSVKESPDGVFVTAEEPDSSVRIAKQGRHLLIRTVEGERGGRGERADIKVPLAVVEALLSGGGEELDLGAAIQALARQGEGELVTVDGENETVRIWIDRVAEPRSTR